MGSVFSFQLGLLDTIPEEVRTLSEILSVTEVGPSASKGAEMSETSYHDIVNDTKNVPHKSFIRVKICKVSNLVLAIIALMGTCVVGQTLVLY